LFSCICIFKVITLACSSQRNYFENATACFKRTLKTTVATQLKKLFLGLFFTVTRPIMSDTMPQNANKFEGETIPISDVESALECDVCLAIPQVKKKPTVAM